MDSHRDTLSVWRPCKLANRTFSYESLSGVAYNITQPQFSRPIIFQEECIVQQLVDVEIPLVDRYATVLAALRLEGAFARVSSRKSNMGAVRLPFKRNYSTGSVSHLFRYVAGLVHGPNLWRTFAG